MIGRDGVLNYMHVLGLSTLYPRKRRGLSSKNNGDKVYPYLLGDIEIKRPNQVWSIDITYRRMARGFMYLAAIIDWHSGFQR